MLIAVSLFVAAPLLVGPCQESTARQEPVRALGEWRLERERVEGGELTSSAGGTAAVEGSPEFVDDALGSSMMFDGKDDLVLIGELADVKAQLPSERFTLAAWVSVNTPQRWGGILGALQDNGNDERGFLLGYNSRVFSIGLATVGADDGNGKITYLSGKTPYDVGRLHFVVATYDGTQLELYVDGQLENTSDQQSGAVLYPATTKYVIGAYHDDDEVYRHHGRVRSISVWDVGVDAEWVAAAYEAGQALRDLEPYIWIDPDHEFVVEPYLQFITRTTAIVAWETTRPSTSSVAFGTTSEFGDERIDETPTTRHEVLLEKLVPQTPYFYQVSAVDSEERRLSSEVLTFQTAVDPLTPFAFAVLSDTQDNPIVAGELAAMAWAQRPNFAIHAGDLVGTGSMKSEWTDEFFPSMQVLMKRVPLYPVLGNHEEDARHYYDYMALPDPEYYYEFSYGNAQFFMLDSNRELGPESEQYQWLESRLRVSTAVWKFVCYHHPTYTSDENDYGDTWNGPSTYGDERTRGLTALYDRYGVDVVWNGHIHSYERSWPLSAGRATLSGGTIYMVTGGGGGELETPGPTRPWFQNNVLRGHHYCMVAINGTMLEFKAFNLDGALFDQFTLNKSD